MHYVIEHVKNFSDLQLYIIDCKCEHCSVDYITLFGAGDLVMCH